MNKQIVFIIFTILFSNKILGQIDSITINQDPKLSKVLELKKIVNQEAFTSGQYTIQIFSGNFNDSQELMNKIKILMSFFSASKHRIIKSELENLFQKLKL